MADIGTLAFSIGMDISDLRKGQTKTESAMRDISRTVEREVNRIDKNFQKTYANSYGRNMPSHDILQTNTFGKIIEDVEYCNYKNQCASMELQVSQEGKSILQSYNQQVKEMHNQYEFDNYMDTIGCYTKFFSLDNNETASNQDIIWAGK